MKGRAGAMSRTHGSLLIAVALAVAGCGARAAPGPVAPGHAAEAGQAASAATPPGAPVASVSTTAEATRRSEVVEATSSPTAAPDYGPKHNNGAVRLELSATCVQPGDVLIVTITSPPKSTMGMLIAYSDRGPHGAMFGGESDDNGRFVWRVPVEPTVPEGQATVLVSATGPHGSQEGGGTADKKFQVSRAGC